jgi:phage shock protein A
MSVMKRLSGIFQAKANKLLDKAEDPRESLDLAYQKQLDQLQQLRRGVADVTTAKKRIELQASQLQQQADKLQSQAKAALTQGNEDLAREALARRTALEPQLVDLGAQHDQVAAQEVKLTSTLSKVQAQVDSFRTKKETMKATYTAAQAQTKIGEAVSGISESMSDAGMSVQRAQDKIDNMQARAGAMDELLASGAITDLTNPVDDIQAQLDKASTQTSVDAQLAALKAEVGAGAPVAEVGSGSPAPEKAGDGSPADGAEGSS